MEILPNGQTPFAEGKLGLEAWRVNTGRHPLGASFKGLLNRRLVFLAPSASHTFVENREATGCVGPQLGRNQLDARKAPQKRKVEEIGPPNNPTIFNVANRLRCFGRKTYIKERVRTDLVTIATKSVRRLCGHVFLCV